MRKGFIVFSHTLTKEQEKELNNKYFITEIVFLPDKFQKLWSSVDNNNYYDNYY